MESDDARFEIRAVAMILVLWDTLPSRLVHRY